MVPDVPADAWRIVFAEARRRAVREELDDIFAQMDSGKAIPTTDDGFANMVRDKAAKYGG